MQNSETQQYQHLLIPHIQIARMNSHCTSSLRIPKPIGQAPFSTSHVHIQPNPVLAILTFVLLKFSTFHPILMSQSQTHDRTPALPG